MSKDLVYPDDWPEVAEKAKTKANWTCETCGSSREKNPKNIITVHHLDHNTMNSKPSNLVVLCQKCHLRLEGIYRVKNHRGAVIALKLSQGQTVLPGFKKALSSKPHSAAV